MFRHPESPGKTPRLSKSRANALRRKDRFPKLPLWITLKETWVAIGLHWRELLALSWLTLSVYVAASFVFHLLARWFMPGAAENFGLYLIQIEILGLIRAGLLEFLLIGFYALAVYRLMLLGESISTPRYSDVWLRRYMLFLVATLRAMLLPLLAFVPYVLFIALLVYWAGQGSVPGFVPRVLYVAEWPGIVLKAVCALGFYILFARFVFVQAATAVDVPYSPRESWRVTNWVWHHILILTLATLGVALTLIIMLMVLWPVPSGALGALAVLPALIVTCALWLAGVTAFVVSLSIAFCLRTGWRPGAQKLALRTKPSPKPHQ